MRRAVGVVLVLVVILIVSGVGCGDDGGVTPAPPVATNDASVSEDAGTDVAVVDAKPDVRPTTSGDCTTTLGNAITQEYGRLDGIVRAVVVHGDPKCFSDDNHAIVQVDAAGATYNMWINVEGKIANLPPTVRFQEKASTFFLGDPWTSGWNRLGVFLAYPRDLDSHDGDFVPLANEVLTAVIIEKLPPGTKVSIYAHGFNTKDGAHNIHRNWMPGDGAVVVDPGGAAQKYLLFAFDNQTF